MSKVKTYNGVEVKRTLITKRQLITETAKALGDKFTIADVKEVYKALQRTAKAHLLKANEYDIVTVNLGDGLTITSSIKDYNSDPRMWFKAKISRHSNQKINKEPLENEENTDEELEEESDKTIFNYWDLYLEYLEKWNKSHKGKHYEGLSPNTYEEWLETKKQTENILKN